MSTSPRTSLSASGAADAVLGSQGYKVWGAEPTTTQVSPSGWFPHAVVRITGMSIDRLDSLVSAAAFSEIVGIASRAERAGVTAQAVSERLHALVPNEPKRIRRKLLKLRRSLFDRRPPTLEQIAAISDLPLRQDVEALTQELKGLNAARTSVAKVLREANSTPAPSGFRDTDAVGLAEAAEALPPQTAFPEVPVQETFTFHPKEVVG